MSTIARHDVNEEWAHSGIIEAGDFAFVGYCVGNTGQDKRRRLMVLLTAYVPDLNQLVCL